MTSHHSKRTARHRVSLALALCGLFAFVATAGAVVYVYTNGFNSKSSYKAIKTLSGGKKCQRSYQGDSKTMRIELRGRTFCEYSPPVTGDRDQPDHEIVAVGQILRTTPKNVRRNAYLAVRVRVGEGTFYDFRVTPKGRRYKLTREPAGAAAALPIAGTASSIKRLGQNNRIRLRISDNRATAFVNGESVAFYNDPNPGQVTGRKVSFGVGSTKRASPGPVGRYTSVKVGVPNP